jgi:hypothetical protein
MLGKLPVILFSRTSRCLMKKKKGDCIAVQPLDRRTTQHDYDAFHARPPHTATAVLAPPTPEASPHTRALKPRASKHTNRYTTLHCCDTHTKQTARSFAETGTPIGPTVPLPFLLLLSRQHHSPSSTVAQPTHDNAGKGMHTFTTNHASLTVAKIVRTPRWGNCR